MPVTEPVLTLAGITKHFGALAVSRQVSFELHNGEIHALIGPNGAGKTTLIKQITGTLQPDAGQVLFQGRDVTDLPAPARARLGIARTFQISALAMEQSVLENMLLALIGHDRQVWQFWQPVLRHRPFVARAHAALAKVGLEDDAPRLVATLSHGQRRQLELALALVVEPLLMLLDEPMAGLGADGAMIMTGLLKEIGQATPILLIEHDMDAVFALADRISVLVDGAVIASGTPAAIRGNPAVQEAYLGEGMGN